MRPKNIPESMVRGKSPRFLPKHIKCPPGSVLIKRTTQEDLIMDKKIKALGLINYPTSFHFNTTGVGPNDSTIDSGVSKICHKFVRFYILAYNYIYILLFTTRSFLVFSFLSVQYATARYAKHNFGAKTVMNVWNPTTSSDQATFANLWIVNGPADALNVIQAGWGVSNTCHLFILLPKRKAIC